MNDKLSILPPAPAESGFQPMAAMEEPPRRSSFSARKCLVAFRKYWWAPLLALAIAGGAGYARVRQIPPTYLSRASLWETEKLRLPEGPLFTDDVQNYFGTQTELLRSGKMCQMAVARLQATGSNAIPADREGKALPIRLNVFQSPRSSIIIVEATSSDPSYTRAFLSALVDEFILYKKNIRKAVSGDTLASISEQLLRLERELNASQEALSAFQKTNNLALLQEEGSAMGGHLTQLKLRLADLNLESELLEAVAADPPAGAETNSASLPTSSDSLDPQIAYRELELLKIQRTKLSQKLRPKHPRMIKLEADIERAEQIIRIFHTQTREQLANSRSALKTKIESIQAAIKEWEPKVVEANARIAEAERLKLALTRAQFLYDQLAGTLQKVDISRNIDQDALSVLEPASAPERSFAQERSILTEAGVCGLAVGLGIIMLIAMRDDRLTSLTEVCGKLGVNIVGQIPRLESPKDKSPLPLLAGEDPRHIYAESYRNLRSAILFQSFEGGRPKVILVTSAVPSEGKSAIAANLARAMALGGAKVLLVDGDLRKGELHRAMGLRREPGLVDLLCNPNDLDNVVQQDSLPNLAFVGAGSRRANPGDLFLGPTLDTVLSLFRKNFDHVIIDSSPVFAVDDVTTLAPLVDGTLFVVRSRFSQSCIVREALDLLYQRQAKVLGLIFNAADASAHNYKYYKYREYHGAAARS